MKKLIIFILGLVFVLAGCNQEKKNRDFLQGEWESSDEGIKITFNKDSVITEKEGDDTIESKYEILSSKNPDEIKVDTELKNGGHLVEHYYRDGNDKMEYLGGEYFGPLNNTRMPQFDVSGGGELTRVSGGGGFFSGLWTIIKAVAFLLFLAFAGYTIYYALREKRQNKEG